MPTASPIKTFVFAMSVVISLIDTDESLSCFALQANNPIRKAEIKMIDGLTINGT
jgi:hypothetical protein